MEVSPAEMGRYGTCKAKMGPDMAHIGKPFRLGFTATRTVQELEEEYLVLRKFCCGSYS